MKLTLAGTGLALLLATVAYGETPIQRAEMSGRLFELGLQERDPLLMIAAAKLRKPLDLQKGDLTPEKSDGSRDTGAGIVTWGDMLDTALDAAPDDPQIAALVDDVRTAKTKGVTSGQVYSITTLRAKGKDVYPALTYTGGVYAEVYVEGKGGADINLYVMDHQNRLVCSDTDLSPIAYCGWRPAQSGAFVIQVHNDGAHSSEYSLITN